MFTGRLSGGAFVTSTPRSSTRPPVGSSNPPIMRRVVVLPHPDGPSREKNSPSPMVRSTRSTAVTVPRREWNRLAIPTSSMAGTVVGSVVGSTAGSGPAGPASVFVTSMNSSLPPEVPSQNWCRHRDTRNLLRQPFGSDLRRALAHPLRIRLLMKMRRGKIVAMARTPARITTDDVSRAIIEQLQADGRRSYASIGQAVGLSEAAVRQRVQKLIDSGVMQIVAVTDPMQIGFARQAMVGISVSGDIEVVAAKLAQIPEV